MFHLVIRWLLSVSFILLGPFYVIYGGHVITLAVKSQSWPKVVGVVFSSQVVEHKGGKGTNYTPDIKYEYHVGGASYISTHVWLLDYGDNEDWAKQIVAQFPSGSSVTVFYNPSAPERSVLKPGTNWFMFFTAGIGLVVFVVGLAICPAWSLIARWRSSV